MVDREDNVSWNGDYDSLKNKTRPRRGTFDPLSAVIPGGVFGLATQRHLMYY